MSLSLISRSTQRFLLNRLDRLRESLEGLGHRLRACLADTIGTQIGEAIRDALDKALYLKSSPAAPPIASEDARRREPEEGSPDWYWQEEAEEDEPLRDEVEEASPERSQPHVPDVAPQPARWKYVLTHLVELAGWWIQRGSKKLPMIKLLGLSALVGTTTLVAGPVLGGVAMTLSTALLLTSGGPAPQTAMQ